MRRLVAGLVFLAVLIAVLFLGIVAGRRLASSADVYASPESVELPPLPAGDDLVTTRTYLATDGAPVRGLADVTGALVDGTPTAADCRRVAETDLPRLGPPDDVYQAVAATPDKPTAELALAHLDATIRYLAGCLQDDAVDPAELRFTRTLLVRRLGEVG